MLCKFFFDIAPFVVIGGIIIGLYTQFYYMIFPGKVEWSETEKRFIRSRD